MNLTPKQEKFCQKYIESGNASEAYRETYNSSKMRPETINRAAKQLLDNPKITTRIEELQQHHMEKHEFTVDAALLEYEQARIVARDTENASAMVSATTGKCRLFGLDQTKVTSNTKVEIDGLTALMKEIDGSTASIPPIES